MKQVHEIYMKICDPGKNVLQMRRVKWERNNGCKSDNERDNFFEFFDDKCDFGKW